MAKLHYDKHGHTVVITMEGDNDLNLGMTTGAMDHRLAEYADDKDLRCCIVTGAGTRAFSAGANLKRAAESGRVSTGRSVWETPEPTLVNGLTISKPIIAAVNGHAIGAGCMFALACDIRIASENAEFGIPEIKLGFPSGMGAPQRLPRLIPFGLAMEMLLTGDRITAQKALQWGLVNQVVPQSDLMDAALEMANRIAANAPLAVQGLKEIIYRSREMSIDDGLRLSALMGPLARDTEDAREGLKAFSEKRTPDFHGR